MSKNIAFKAKSIEELKTINTKNLLAYYKAERKRFHRNVYMCKCGCHEFFWDLYEGYEAMKNEYLMRDNYLDLIKTELDTREHVNGR